VASDARRYGIVRGERQRFARSMERQVVQSTLSPALDEAEGIGRGVHIVVAPAAGEHEVKFHVAGEALLGDDVEL